MNRILTLLFAVFVCQHTKAAEAIFSYDISGTSAIFYNTSIDATAYTWDFGDGTTSTEAYPVHSYAATSSYRVVLIASSDCCADTAEAYVSFVCALTMTTIDAFESDTMLCVSESAMLIAPYGYFSYTWYLDNVYFTSSDEYTLSTNLPGTYRCIMHTAGGCGAVSNFLTLYNAPSNDATILYSSAKLIIGENIILSCSMPFQNYLWSNGSNAESITASTAGEYSVEVINTFGCSHYLYYTVEIDSTSIPVMTLENPTTLSIENIDLTDVANIVWFKNNEYFASGIVTGIEPTSSANYSAKINYDNGYVININAVEFSISNTVLSIDDAPNNGLVYFNNVAIEELPSTGTMQLYSSNGSKINTQSYTTGQHVDFNLTSGIYIIQFIASNSVIKTVRIRI